MIDRYDVCNSGEVYKFDHGEWVRYDEAQARIAELEVALAKARNDAFQEAANACCHPTNVHDGGASAICRGRVLAALKIKE
jgi:hypothetical protein